MQGNTFFGFSGGGGSTPPPVSNSWLLNGNTEGAEKYFGTNDNYSIPIYTNGSAIGIFLNTGDFGFGTIAPTSRVHIKGLGSTSSNYALKIDNSDSSPLLYIQNDGYIGVGTASPNALMDIVAANATPFAFSIRNSTHTANTAFGYKIYQENSGYMTFYMDGAKYMSISPNGSVSYSKSSYTSTDTQLISQAFAAGNASYGFYCRGYLSNNGLSVDGDGNVGINQLTASAKLHIKGINSTSANYALKIDNSSSSPLFYVTNSSRIIINGTSSNSPSGVDTAIFTSNLSGYTFQHAANITWLYDNNVKMFNAIGADYGTVGTFTAHDFYIRTNNVDRIFINSTGNVGIGIPSPAAKLHIKGINSTSANYALTIDNSALSPLLYVRNDSFTSLGTSTEVIGTSGHKLEAVGTSAIGLGLGAYFSVAFSTSESYAKDMGAGIALGGKYDASGNVNPFAGIGGVKQNATNGDFTGRLNLWVRNGSTIASSFTSVPYGSKVRNGMGIINPLALLHLSGDNSDVFVSESGCINADGYGGKFYANIANTQKNIGIYSEVANGLFNYSAILIGGNVGNNIVNPISRFHNFGVDSTTGSNQRLEPVINVTEDTTGNTINTINATANVTAQTIAVPSDKVISLESTIVYRKTGGAGVGTIGDGTTIKLNSSVKNISGILTLDTVQNTYTGTVNAIVGVSATYTISGTNVLVSVTGVVNDSITWNVITKVNTVA